MNSTCTATGPTKGTFGTEVFAASGRRRSRTQPHKVMTQKARRAARVARIAVTGPFKAEKDPEFTGNRNKDRTRTITKSEPVRKSDTLIMFSLTRAIHIVNLPQEGTQRYPWTTLMSEKRLFRQ